MRRLLLLLVVLVLCAAGPAPSGTRWEWDGKAWRAIGAKPPACPAPLRITPPTDLTKTTAILWPGQVRGGHYKAHGGFRLDGQAPATIVVRSPVTGVAVRGARYIEAGEPQHLVDIQMPCGVMVRLDHLRSPTGALAAVFAKLPKSGDTRTINFNPPVAVTAGAQVSAGAGFVAMNNPSFDLGVYDLRARNGASRNPRWAATHDPAMAWHAVCWFDVLAPADAARVRSLPAGDGQQGKTSDLCR